MTTNGDGATAKGMPTGFGHHRSGTEQQIGNAGSAWQMMHRRFPRFLALAAIVVLAGASAATATPRFPYSTTVQNGDIRTARVLFGDSAQGGVRGKDAAPVFTDLSAYEPAFAR